MVISECLNVCKCVFMHAYVYDTIGRCRQACPYARVHACMCSIASGVFLKLDLLLDTYRIGVRGPRVSLRLPGVHEQPRETTPVCGMWFARQSGEGPVRTAKHIATSLHRTHANQAQVKCSVEVGYTQNPKTYTLNPYNVHIETVKLLALPKPSWASF